MEKQGYNQRLVQQLRRDATMPKQNVDALTDFGKRLMTLRKTAGYTQVELAKELEVSQRMISHYEGHTDFPPSALLPKLSQVLGVTSDELLGIKAIKKTRQPDTRLQRRMQQIDKMSAQSKRQVLQLIDAFIEREQLKKTAAKK